MKRERKKEAGGEGGAEKDREAGGGGRRERERYPRREDKRERVELLDIITSKERGQEGRGGKYIAVVYLAVNI